MAKRKRKEQKKFNIYDYVENNRVNIMRGFWVLAAVLCIILGYSRGYPLVAAGQGWTGVLIGLAWGVGAFLAIVLSFFLNRKLKGL
ncbi:MAG: hypothetical protein FOGNACKC_05243 [Anaerolineae bacterium]|nr:hypothetical protein [Anaerolineae bacterium]